MTPEQAAALVHAAEVAAGGIVYLSILITLAYALGGKR